MSDSNWRKIVYRSELSTVKLCIDLTEYVKSAFLSPTGLILSEATTLYGLIGET
jgi:hypothetical protein